MCIILILRCIFTLQAELKAELKWAMTIMKAKVKKKLTLYTSRNKFSSLTQHLEPNTMSPFVISILLYPSCTKTLAQSIMEMKF